MNPDHTALKSSHIKTFSEIEKQQQKQQQQQQQNLTLKKH